MPGPRRYADNMSPTLRSIQGELERLARDVSPRIHLAEASTREAWADLEPKLEDFERRAELSTDRVGHRLVDQGMELQARLRGLRARVWHDLGEVPSASGV